MKQMAVVIVAYILGIGSTFAGDFLTELFNGLEFGMSTNEVLEQRPNATVDYPLMHPSAVCFGEIAQTNFTSYCYVYCFGTNGLRAVMKGGSSTAGGELHGDSVFDAQVNANLSNGFTNAGEQLVIRYRGGVETSCTVTIWAEDATGRLVGHLSDSNETSIVYFEPAVFGMTNFFSLAE